MNESEKYFCFCTLALGSKYRNLAKELAADLEKYSRLTKVVIYTDNPEDFREVKNVLAFKHRQKGILHCYHDKRFVLQKALSMFRAAIYIDADTRILADVPDIEWEPGITGRYENLSEHISKFRPQSMDLMKSVADKLDISWEKANFIGESLYIIARDEGREEYFFTEWDRIGNYLELKGMYGGEGNAMGLAAAKVGWTVKKNEGWEHLNKIRKHLDASYGKGQITFWENWRRRLGYHYRLNKARLAALKNFNFYYR
ncbi:hypothetical protein [Argonema galeatum]|uniref:hypothetical protein n=1 Tax=Argonema galeatum TaxID=2942762 RepID=UPI0020116913|nr:hypothetical protein [Argonema galeatum]MCL1466743.1 hypothetical protein [Argonema galeatum A003/A1]